MLLTDCTIVLGQLGHEPYKCNMWTVSCISEIQTLTNIHNWYHMDSGNNVTDDASRGLNPSEIGKDYRWQKGPDFMKKDINEWPIKHAQKSPPSDLKQAKVTEHNTGRRRSQYGFRESLGACDALLTISNAVQKSLECEILGRKCHQPQPSGVDTTLALVREQFWILNGKRFVGKVASQYPYCRCLRKKIAQVEIAPRKVEQLVSSPVFEHVVIDIAGPFNTIADCRMTKNYRVNSGKAWILVIVCRASAVAHKEVLEGYNSNCFLAGFDAFTISRGKPTSVTADPGL
ncbi:uncharacterized protein [Palaemon carinicauda]|uniref:uncharacterized protein n=1 Tax=Palaemon carinicauda TaxID=392227 RepID=UPI0035B59E0B